AAARGYRAPGGRSPSPATAGAIHGVTASTTSGTSIRRPMRCWASPAARSRSSAAAAPGPRPPRAPPRAHPLAAGPSPPGGRYAEPKPEEIDYADALASIAKVKLPRRDPVYGAGGPLLELWRKPGPGRRGDVE